MWQGEEWDWWKITVPIDSEKNRWGMSLEELFRRWLEEDMHLNPTKLNQLGLDQKRVEGCWDNFEKMLLKAKNHPNPFRRGEFREWLKEKNLGIRPNRHILSPMYGGFMFLNLEIHAEYHGGFDPLAR
ncbi:MAG: hypothetical protein WAP52_00765 [Candidatus Sungiibacteriota bacterium]